MNFEEVVNQLSEITVDYSDKERMAFFQGMLATLNLKDISESAEAHFHSERNTVEIPETGIGDLSDGYHTFNQLYYQRMMLFAAIVKQNQDKAWKSLRHEDGELCFGGGWFIVGIDTPEGAYTYHYENKYWNMFDCADLPRSKHWDGHTEKDVTRLLSLPSSEPECKTGEVDNNTNMGA